MGTSSGSPPWHAACEALYRQHAARILRLGCLVLDDRYEAQDVAQEVFVKLLRAYPAADGRMQWGPWLTTVMLNACRDRRRSRWWRLWRTQPERVEELDVVDPGPGPERAALGAEARARIGHAFRELPTRQREVVALRYVDGCSIPEVADILGLTAGSVKRHLFRAVRRLRAALGDEP